MIMRAKAYILQYSWTRPLFTMLGLCLLLVSPLCSQSRVERHLPIVPMDTTVLQESASCSIGDILYVAYYDSSELVVEEDVNYAVVRSFLHGDIRFTFHIPEDVCDSLYCSVRDSCIIDSGRETPTGKQLYTGSRMSLSEEDQTDLPRNNVIRSSAIVDSNCFVIEAAIAGPIASTMVQPRYGISKTHALLFVDMHSGKLQRVIKLPLWYRTYGVFSAFVNPSGTRVIQGIAHSDWLVTKRPTPQMNYRCYDVTRRTLRYFAERDSGSIGGGYNNAWVTWIDDTRYLYANGAENVVYDADDKPVCVLPDDGAPRRYIRGIHIAEHCVGVYCIYPEPRRVDHRYYIFHAIDPGRVSVLDVPRQEGRILYCCLRNDHELCVYVKTDIIQRITYHIGGG